MKTFHDYTLQNIMGGELPLSVFKDKTVLVVNVASKCGLTPQYEKLEPLYQQFKEKGFEVLGIPCNQFLGQEPGSNEDIQLFCQTNYQVTFPMTEKIDVNGEGRNPLYDFLAGDLAVFPGDIQWNFEKFLVGRDGKVLNRFSPKVEPDAEEILEAIHEDMKTDL